jgi:uncharacterized peroxidase-related enzyme
MPRIKSLKKNELNDASTLLLNAVEKKLGTVPNMFSTFAHSSAALKGYLDLSDNLENGILTTQQREIISLAVAQYNRCQYCISAHSLMAKGAGLTDGEISKARDGSSNNSLNHAIASFALKITELRGVISDDTYNHFAGLGLSSELMIEVVANVTLNLLTNYVNHLADTEVDFPLVDLTSD